MSSLTAAAPRKVRLSPIPITLVTGFLGAGKTTFLNRVLPDPALADAAVIINEFGEVSLDHLLVGRVDDDIVELSSGCLCCTVRGALVSTLEDFLRRLDNGRIPALSRILIETTGLADPAPVLQAVLLHPYLSRRFRLAGVLTLVDAVDGLGTIKAHPEAMRQVVAADRVLVTKADLLSDADRASRLDALGDLLSRLNPGAPVTVWPDETLPLAALLEAGPSGPTATPNRVSEWLGLEPARGASHDHLHHHHHDHGPDDVSHDAPGAGQDSHDVNRHSASIRAITLSTEQAIPPEQVSLFFELLAGMTGPRLLRMKGIVKLAGEESRPVVLQAAQTVLHPPIQLDSWPGPERSTRLVFIVDGVPQQTVQDLFDAFTGAPGIDRPDAAALTDNPLSIPGT